MEIIRGYFETQRANIKSALGASRVPTQRIDELLRLLVTNMLDTMLIVGPEPLFEAFERKNFTDFINFIDVYTIASELDQDTDTIVDAIQLIWPSMQDYIINHEDSAVTVATSLFGDMSEGSLDEIKKLTD